jgi:hypothetical protein
MPTPEKFLSSFGFIKGSQFDGYILDQTNSTHTSIERYKEYEYHIELSFSNIDNGTWETLFAILRKTISEEHIIKGARNPYKCNIDYPSYGDVHGDNNHIKIFLTGHSYRV